MYQGSTTVSNLTFGDIQKVAALTIHKPVTTLLALQTAGATLGNMICINNIISAKVCVSKCKLLAGAPCPRRRRS